MGMEGHRVELGVVDEINTFFQPELPLAEVSLEEHKRLTGHEPLSTEHGWICVEAAYDHKQCMATWPPLTPQQQKFEEMILDVLQTGRHEKDGLEIDYQQKAFPVLPDPNRINKPN